MTKVSLILVAAAAVVASSPSQALTFNLSGDWLADQYVNNGIPNGALIMLVASTQDREFDAPGGNSYVPAGSDDVILGTFTANDANGSLNRGSYLTSIRVQLNDAAAGLEALDGGDPLLLRWFPTLTKTHAKQPPANGNIPYGEFRSDQVSDGSTDPWITPSSNSATVSLSITTASPGNIYDPKGNVTAKELAAAQALTTAVYEAASYATMSVTTLANGAISLSWPLLEDGLGQVQQSADLVTWQNVAMDNASLTEDSATLQTDRSEKRMFFRISSGE